MSNLPEKSARFNSSRLLEETFLKHVEVFPRLGSTNDTALERIADDLPALPFLIVAEEQVAGRGRGENRWWSTHGALTFSLVLDRQAEQIADHWPRLSLLTGLALRSVIAATVPHCDIRLKWPNDVYINGRKACGTLIESSTVPPQPLVVGIGINVNNPLTEAPSDVRDLATSLCDVAGKEFDRTAILIAFLHEFESLFQAAGAADFSLPEAWRPACYLEGRTVHLDAGQKTVVGVCQGIDDDGAILLHNEAGLHRCFAGVVVKIL